MVPYRERESCQQKKRVLPGEEDAPSPSKRSASRQSRRRGDRQGKPSSDISTATEAKGAAQQKPQLGRTFTCTVPQQRHCTEPPQAKARLPPPPVASLILPNFPGRRGRGGLFQRPTAFPPHRPPGPRALTAGEGSRSPSLSLRPRRSQARRPSRPKGERLPQPGGSQARPTERPQTEGDPWKGAEAPGRELLGATAAPRGVPHSLSS